MWRKLLYCIKSPWLFSINFKDVTLLCILLIVCANLPRIAGKKKTVSDGRLKKESDPNTSGTDGWVGYGKFFFTKNFHPHHKILFEWLLQQFWGVKTHEFKRKPTIWELPFGICDVSARWKYCEIMDEWEEFGWHHHFRELNWEWRFESQSRLVCQSLFQKSKLITKRTPRSLSEKVLWTITTLRLSYDMRCDVPLI